MKALEVGYRDERLALEARAQAAERRASEAEHEAQKARDELERFRARLERPRIHLPFSSPRRTAMAVGSSVLGLALVISFSLMSTLTLTRSRNALLTSHHRLALLPPVPISDRSNDAHWELVVLESTLARVSPGDRCGMNAIVGSTGSGPRLEQLAIACNNENVYRSSRVYVEDDGSWELEVGETSERTLRYALRFQELEVSVNPETLAVRLTQAGRGFALFRMTAWSEPAPDAAGMAAYAAPLSFDREHHLVSTSVQNLGSFVTTPQRCDIVIAPRSERWPESCAAMVYCDGAAVSNHRSLACVTEGDRLASVHSLSGGTQRGESSFEYSGQAVRILAPGGVLHMQVHEQLGAEAW